MRKLLIFLSLIALLSLSISANANDAGYINYSSSSDLNYNGSGVTGNAPFDATYMVFNKFILDTGNYTSLNTATVYTYNIFVFPKASDYTTFTFTSGATGSGGYVNYVSTSSGGIISYVFNPDMVVTSSQEVILNLATNIFSGTTRNTTYDATGFDVGLVLTYPLNLTSPFTLTCANAGCGLRYVGASTGADATPEQFLTYDIEALANVSVQYNVTYFSISGNPYFNATISKPGATQTIPTIVRIQNQAIYTYAEDLTLSATSTFNAFGLYSTGLYANITDSHGDSDTFTINSTGTITPTPAPTPVLNPSTQAGIVWDKNNYTVNEIGTITWLIDSSILSYLYNFNIQIQQFGLPVQTFDNLPSSALTGSVQYQFDTAGVYTANFYKSICAFGVCATNTLLDSQDVTVTFDPSYLFINSSVAVGKSVNISYKYGFTPQNQVPANGIYAVKDGMIKQFVTAGTSITGNTLYNTTIVFPEAGTYTVQLKDFTLGVVTYKTVIAVAGVFVPPTQNITTTSLSLDKLSYNLNDVIDATYTIDNNNYSNYSVYYQINNYATGSMSDYGQVGEQIGHLYVDIAPNFQSGLNKFALRAKNDTDDYEITFQNFTFSQTNNRGFGMQVTPPYICKGNKNVINLTIPEVSTFKIYVTSSSFLVKNVIVNNNTFLSWTPQGDQSYTFEIWTNNDDALQLSYTINPGTSCISPVVTATTAINTATTTQTSNQISSLLQSTAFWGLVFVIGIMLTVAIYENRSKKQ